MRTVTEPYENVVVVCDNAPVHCSLETVIEEEEFSGVELLRTAPYSAPINPIEECWSTMKAAMKRELGGKMKEMLAKTPENMTQTEYRLNFLEKIIDNNINTITPRLCLSTFNHIQKHFAPILELQDLKMDDNV
jgi:transposase